MAQLADGTPIGGYVSTDNIIGAGGWVTRFPVGADDGTQVCGGDGLGPHILRPDATEWDHLLKPGVNTNAFNTLALIGGGTYDIAICATDSDSIAWVVGGYVWITRDGGATVTKSSLPQSAGAASTNDGLRASGNMLEFDPVNANVLWFCAPEQVHYTTNGGTSWTSISTATIPAVTSNRRMVIAFDRHSAVSGGRTQGIYIMSNGNNLYRTTNGGTSWAAVSGAPTNCCHMLVAQADGYLHMSGNGTTALTGQYRRFDGVSTWIAPAGVTNGKSVAVSPHNAGHIYLTGDGGNIYVSTNNGTTWSNQSDIGGRSRIATSIDYLAWCSEIYMTHGNTVFSALTNRLWVGEGVGAWYIDNPPSTISFNQLIPITEFSAGLENMTMTHVDVTEDGDLLTTCHDRRGFVIPYANIGEVYPARHIAHVGPTSIIHGGMIDSAPEDPDFLVACLFGYVGVYSEDRGATWTDLPGSILAASGGSGGGNIIAFSSTTFVQRETNNGKLMRTTDGGATWNRCTIGDNSVTSGHHTYWAPARVLVKDRFNPSTTAYYYQPGDTTGSAGDLACRGIWKTTNAGATWTRIKSTYINGAGDYWYSKLRQVNATTWLWCGGSDDLGVKISTDSMVTWAALTGTDDVHGASSFGEVYGIGITPGATPSSPPAILAVGFRAVSPTGSPANYAGWGYWLSLDLGLTWERIFQFPEGVFISAADVAGDPNRFGVFYVAANYQGVLRIKYRDRRLCT